MTRRFISLKRQPDAWCESNLEEKILLKYVQNLRLFLNSLIVILLLPFFGTLVVSWWPVSFDTLILKIHKFVLCKLDFFSNLENKIHRFEMWQPLTLLS